MTTSPATRANSSAESLWPVWRRHILGMIAVALLAAGILLWIWPPASSELMFLHGVLVKSGTTLLMLWLALPQLEKMPVWLIVPIGLVAVLVIAYPQVRPLLVRGLVFLAPLLFVLWLLRPPKNRRS